MTMDKGLKYNPKQLIKLREKTKLSCADFGARIGVSRQVIYMWEHGETVPLVKSLERLCDEFNVKPNYFFREVLTAYENPTKSKEIG